MNEKWRRNYKKKRLDFIKIEGKISNYAVNELYFAGVKSFTTIIYNMKTESFVMEIKGKSVYIEFHPKILSLVILALEYKDINIFQIPNEKPICIFKGHNDEILFSIFNPNKADYIASTSLDKTIKIWSVHSSLLDKNLSLSSSPIIMKWSLCGNLLGVLLSESNKLTKFKK